MRDNVFFDEIKITATSADHDIAMGDKGAMAFVKQRLDTIGKKDAVNTVIAEWMHNAIDHSRIGVGGDDNKLVGYPVSLRVEFSESRDRCTVAITNFSDRLRATELNGRLGILSANKGSGIDFHYFGAATHIYGTKKMNHRGRGLVEVSGVAESENVVSCIEGPDLIFNTVRAEINLNDIRLEAA